MTLDKEIPDLESEEENKLWAKLSISLIVILFIAKILHDLFG